MANIDTALSNLKNPDTYSNMNAYNSNVNIVATHIMSNIDILRQRILDSETNKVIKNAEYEKALTNVATQLERIKTKSEK